jgi:hypothetical protein
VISMRNCMTGVVAKMKGSPRATLGTERAPGLETNRPDSRWCAQPVSGVLIALPLSRGGANATKDVLFIVVVIVLVGVLAAVVGLFGY